MPHDTDDEALTWAGDSEPAADAAPEPAAAGLPPTRAVASGWKVVGSPGETQQAGQATDSHERTQMGSVTLVLHGILAGMYLLYTIGWLLVLQRDAAAPTDIIGGTMHAVGLWLAVLAPALWFGTVLWLTRGSLGSRARLIALAVGVIVLAPVPFLLGGTA